jgi:hypothetical protein
MALKDWKKTLDEATLFHYYNSKKKKILRGQKIYKDWSMKSEWYNPAWRVTVGKNIHGRILRDYLITKSQTLRFAKSYMRSH